MCSVGYCERHPGVISFSLFLPVLFLLLCFVFLVSPAQAANAGLAKYLREISASELVPGAEAFGAIEGTPPVAPVMKDGRHAGYAFLNTDVVNAVGYSGKPIHVLVALDMDGKIIGARLMDHHEPIVLIGIPEPQIRDYINGYVGHDIVQETITPVDLSDLDIIAGATVTIMVIDDSIRRSALIIARQYGLGHLTAEKKDVSEKVVLKDGPVETRSWEDLVGDGSVRRMSLTVGEVTRAFEQSGQMAAAQNVEDPDPNASFIDLYVAQVSVPTIGKSLLGEREYRNLQKRLKDGQQAFLVMGSGLYSFKGSGYVRGGVFDRLQLVQGDRSVRFRDRHHKRLSDVKAEGAPDFTEVSLFYIPRRAGFEATQPWRIELLVSRATGPREKGFTSFDLGYQLPERYLKRIELLPAVPPQGTTAAAPQDEAEARNLLWQRMWKGSVVEIAILAVLLGVLTVIFFFQDWLVRRQKLMTWLRTSFLVIVLFWLGFYLNAQLSVVNVLTFANALITDFSWGYFLMAPLIFILWIGVAAGMLFWGRGVFCGWLCPYGALQELTNRLGRFLKIPQIELPWGLNERLWPVKYIIFLGLFAVSFYSMSLAETLAEVEPFKTAIIMNFNRAWPYVLFAGGLIVVNLFIERFFCRYLCPLGAALAIPGKMRMFDWLKRYKECGNPCQSCANICPTAAIHPDGRINVNECIYCLDCQKLYYDDQLCPHMIQQRIKREQRLLKASDSTLSAKQREEKARLQEKKANSGKNKKQQK
tara:strand:+ start:2003 stop:4279 length:2277 start_codon:yes stop_codon:yes gene_type:complete